MGNWENPDNEIRQKKQGILDKIREIDRQLAEIEKRSEALPESINLIGATGGLDVDLDIANDAALHRELDDEKTALMQKLKDLI